MTTTTLANEFEQFLRSFNLSTKREDSDSSITVFAYGKYGTAEVEFSTSDITAMIDADLIHSWSPLPNSSDMRASAKKVRDLID